MHNVRGISFKAGRQMGPKPLLSFQGSDWACTVGWCGGHLSPRHGGVGTERSLGKAWGLGAGSFTGKAHLSAGDSAYSQDGIQTWFS